MGPYSFWIAASIVYAALSAAIYLWICHSRGHSRLLLRGVVAFIGYLAVALTLVWALYKFVGK